MGIPEQIEIARGILAGNKCAECGESLKFKDATKRRYSFDIICRLCAAKSQIQTVIFDEAVDVNLVRQDDERRDEALNELKTFDHVRETGK